MAPMTATTAASTQVLMKGVTGTAGRGRYGVPGLLMLIHVLEDAVGPRSCRAALCSSAPLLAPFLMGACDCWDMELAGLGSPTWAGGGQRKRKLEHPAN